MVSIISGSAKDAEYRKRTVRAAKMFIPEFVLSLMAEHADAGLDADREIMGLMIGRFYRDEDGMYAVVDRPVSSKLISDRFSVKFDRDSMEGLFDSLDMDDGESIVGWYHSHLDIGCFMSPTDIATQNGLFGGECGFALVIDPVRKEFKVFDSTPDDPRPADMVVIN